MTGSGTKRKENPKEKPGSKGKEKDKTPVTTVKLTLEEWAESQERLLKLKALNSQLSTKLPKILDAEEREGVGEAEKVRKAR